jgi:hypothetical protein
LARDATNTDREKDRALVVRERNRHAAALLLERIRAQMTDVYRPIAAAHCASVYTMDWMARELDFEWLRLAAHHHFFMRPSEQLYPHLEVHAKIFLPEYHKHQLEAQGATMWHKWSPRDMQVRRNHQAIVPQLLSQPQSLASRYFSVSLVISLATCVHIY